MLAALRKAGYEWCVVEDVSAIMRATDNLNKISRGLEQ